jgi:ABC-type bacteriocin/lantibiotic exporter with double-glycine peptidase domain
MAHSPHAAGHDHFDHVTMSAFRRLLGLFRPERRELIAVVLFAVGVGVCTLAVPIVAMAVVNTVALGTLVQQLFVLCAALFVALGLAGFLQTLQTIAVEFIQRRIFVRVASDLAYRLPRVDLRAFDRQHGPELVNRFFDVLTVQKAAATLLLDGVTITLQVLIGMVLLGFYHTYLLGFDLILLVSLVLLFTVLGWGAVRSAVRESIAKYDVAAWMEEVARHPILFKTAGGPAYARAGTDRLTQTYLEHRAAHFRVLLRQLVFALFLQAAANVALLGLGGVLVIRGELTLGELVAAEIVVTLVVATFTKVGKQLEAYYDLLAAVEKLGHLIDLPLERATGEPHAGRPGGMPLAIHNVTYTYEDAHQDALTDLSFAIKPGERVALVGPNGAGKSTLIDLLFGLRTPSRGWVEMDGADLRSVRLDEMRASIAVVKGIETIQASILENVRMGRPDVTLADVRHALHSVGLDRRVMDFPDGLETVLWTGGSPLSLGQANRLMLARAMVGKPRLLILDETLDHMDAEIRESVLPAIFGRDAAWTVLIVTHSEEVVRLCDRVVNVERAARPVAVAAL